VPIPKGIPFPPGWRPYLVILMVVVFSSIVVLVPFLISIDHIGPIVFYQKGIQAVYRYWDGPLYVIVSKTFYAVDNPLYAASGLWASYFAALLPLYPFTIMLLSPFGSFEAMILSTIIFSCAAALVFYQIVKEFGISENPLLFTLFFCFFPLRWFLYRNVGASEPLFVFLCLTTIYFLKKGQPKYSVISASLATLTRIFGIVLFPVILASLALKKELNLKNLLLSLMIPASLLLLFSYYAVSFGDFFAYFSVNGGTIHEPFYIMMTLLNHYFEELYGILIIGYAIGAVALWERGEKEMSLFILFYLPVITLIAHGDASRYMIPMAPFALIGFERVFPRNKLIFICIIILAAFLSLIYAWTLIPLNPMPLETYQNIVAALGNR
jgi:Gpi18-like mannosyltransferase